MTRMILLIRKILMAYRTQHAECVVKGFLGQWSEKRAILQDALGINSEPEPDKKHTGLDPELCGMVGPDASAGTETDDGCPGDKTRSDKVSEATIFRVKEGSQFSHTLFR